MSVCSRRLKRHGAPCRWSGVGPCAGSRVSSVRPRCLPGRRSSPEFIVGPVAKEHALQVDAEFCLCGGVFCWMDSATRGVWSKAVPRRFGRFRQLSRAQGPVRVALRMVRFHVRAERTRARASAGGVFRGSVALPPVRTGGGVWAIAQVRPDVAGDRPAGHQRTLSSA